MQPAVIGSDRAEIIRRITDEEPESVQRLNPAVPTDLATIVAKSLSKDPSNRYPTAWHLADDLSRFLDGRPITARPVGSLARSWRWCRRKPAQASLAASLVLALAVGFTGITWNWWKAQAAEQRALAQAANAAAAEREARSQSAKADAINRFLIDKLLLLAAPEHNPGGRNVSLREAIDHAAETVGSTFRDQPQIEAALRLALGQTYHELGEYAKSEQHLRVAHDILTHERDDNGLDSLKALIEEGHILDHLGRLQEAEQFLTSAERETSRLLGTSHDLSLMAGRYLASLLQHQGHIDEAERRLRRLSDDSARFRGRKHTEALQIMNDLAVLLRDKQRYAESEPIFRECLRLKREIQGPEHPDTLTTLANLGSVLSALHRTQEAELLLRQCDEIRRRVLGQEHPATLRTTRILGDLLHKSGRSEEARQLLEPCLATQERILGPTHRDTASTRLILDSLLKDRIAQRGSVKP